MSHSANAPSVPFCVPSRFTKTRFPETGDALPPPPGPLPAGRSPFLGQSQSVRSRLAHHFTAESTADAAVSTADVPPPPGGSCADKGEGRHPGAGRALEVCYWICAGMTVLGKDWHTEPGRELYSRKPSCGSSLDSRRSNISELGCSNFCEN
jgi:hypothetical protein